MDLREFEESVLNLVYDEGVDRLTPRRVAQVVSLSVKATERMLDQLVTEGALELDSDDAGNLYYFVPGVGPSGAFGAGANVPRQDDRRRPPRDARRPRRAPAADHEPGRRHAAPRSRPADPAHHPAYADAEYDDAAYDHRGYDEDRYDDRAYDAPHPDERYEYPYGYPSQPRRTSAQPPRGERGPAPYGPPRASHTWGPGHPGNHAPPADHYDDRPDEDRRRRRRRRRNRRRTSDEPRHNPYASPPEREPRRAARTREREERGDWASHSRYASYRADDHLPVRQGAGLTAMVHSSQVGMLRSPTTACILSSFPGAGQLYNGQVGKALTFFMLTMFMYMAVPPLGLIPHIWSAIDAHNTAKRLNAYGLLPP